MFPIPRLLQRVTLTSSPRISVNHHHHTPSPPPPLPLTVYLSRLCTNLPTLKTLHCHVIKSIPPDSFIMTSLVDAYAKCRRVACGRRAFDEVSDRDVVLWTSMIVVYVQKDCAHEGLTLFNKMREAFIHGNEFTIGSLVSACTKLGSLHQGKWVHGFVIKNGVSVNSFLTTSLLNMYVKCGSIYDGRAVFDECVSVKAKTHKKGD